MERKGEDDDGYDTPEWEKSKENVQPRKEGRSARKLNTGLNAISDFDVSAKLKVEKEKYELALRSYEGDDPLSVWHSYINWTEQNYPSGGKSSQLTQLLKACVMNFKNTDQYNNDDRFVQIWIHFCGKFSEPNEMFQYMKSKSIGVQTTAFYVAWATCVEEQGDTKRADRILLEGISADAQPLNTLKKYRDAFLTRTCRQAIAAVSVADEPEEPVESERHSLAPLALTKRGAVPADRASSSRPGRSVVLQPSTVQQKQQKPIQIYTGENAPPTVANPSNSNRGLPNTKENVKEAGKWTKSTSKSGKPISSTVASTDFEIHEDEGCGGGSPKGQTKTVGTALGLSVRKRDKPVETADNVLKTVFITTTDPGEIIQELPMYRKDLVYAGVTEYSPEELLAIRWKKQQEKLKEQEEMANKVASCKESVTEHTQQQIADLRRHVEQFKRQLADETVQHLASVQEKLSSQLHAEMDTYLKSFRNELEELRSETVKQIIEETKAQAALYSDKPFRSTTDHRLSGSATDHQLSGSTTDHRLSGSTTATKLSGSTTGHRLSGSTTDPKLSGSTTGPKLSGYTTGPKLSCSGSNKEAHSHSVVDTEYSQQMDDKTPDPKSVSSVRSSKRHRTPDTSCAKKSFIKMSPFGMTQDCDRLMNDLYNQTFSAPNQNSRIDRIPSTRLSALARADVEQQNAAAIQKPSNFQVYVDDQELQEPAAAIQKPSNFQVYVDDQELQEPAAAIQMPSNFQVYVDDQEFQESAAAIKKPSNFQVYVDDQEPVSASLEPSSFKVYTDQPNTGIAPLERVVSPPHGCQQVEAVSGQQTSLHVEQHSPKVSIGRHSAFSVYSDKENLPARIPAQSTDTLQQEVTECHTEFNFSQQARLASTPFNSDAAPLSEFEFSSIKNTAAAPKFSSAARPSVDFAMTQHLSAISEHSHETYATSSTRSLTGSSRNTTGSSKSSTSSATTRVFSGLTRMRTCSDSQPTEHLTSVDGQQTSVAVVGAADEQGEHHLDIVREESGEIAAGADDMVKSDLMFQRMTPVVDTTFYQPPELTDAMLNTTVFIDPSNPFSESVQAKVLRKVDITSYENVEVRKDAMPKLKVGSQVTVSNLTVKLMSKLGVGGFAVAYKAIVTSADRSTSLGKFSMCNTLDSTAFSESDDVCVKAQKPSCPWELYVCKELRQRVSCMDEDIERDIGSKLMDITHSVFFSDGSLMVNELVPLGSLLNLVNSMKANSCKIPESLVMYVTIELLHAVEVMHRCKIIHGDIKPDNILFCGFPEVFSEKPFSSSSIKLIDFGRGIDMSKFPPGTTFTANNETEGFMCIEMKTQRPWTYQTDLFGVLGTVYTLLFQNYMLVTYNGQLWQPAKFNLHRIYKSRLWAEMFTELLNIESCDRIPSVCDWREKFEAEFSVKEYSKEYKRINNMMK